MQTCQEKQASFITVRMLWQNTHPSKNGMLCWLWLTSSLETRKQATVREVYLERCNSMMPNPYLGQDLKHRVYSVLSTDLPQ